MKRALAIACAVCIVGGTAAAKPSSSAVPRTRPVYRRQKAKPLPSEVVDRPQPAPASAVLGSFQNGLLTVAAKNATLREIIDGVRDSTGAVAEAPTLNERVTVYLGPQPPAQLIAALLEGSHMN
ncbi:MAG: hypothetical protein DMG70_14255 [Acidobacteria bacterium]|nr:MAG: hypothetical protein DMG70_14255 [Acidobacteriota bacterium]